MSHAHDCNLQTSLLVFDNYPFGRLRDSDLPPHGPFREMVEKLDSVTQVPQLMTKVPTPVVINQGLPVALLNYLTLQLLLVPTVNPSSAFYANSLEGS